MTKVVSEIAHSFSCAASDELIRYSLLKDAMVRNIKEYNDKFKSRKLNPENGHRFYHTLF
jgi:DNA segregation ATPase FtsK/SpoIIIE-like protein